MNRDKPTELHGSRRNVLRALARPRWWIWGLATLGGAVGAAVGTSYVVAHRNYEELMARAVSIQIDAASLAEPGKLMIDLRLTYERKHVPAWLRGWFPQSIIILESALPWSEETRFLRGPDCQFSPAEIARQDLFFFAVNLMPRSETAVIEDGSSLTGTVDLSDRVNLDVLRALLDAERECTVSMEDRIAVRSVDPKAAMAETLEDLVRGDKLGRWLSGGFETVEVRSAPTRVRGLR